MHGARGAADINRAEACVSPGLLGLGLQWERSSLFSVLITAQNVKSPPRRQQVSLWLPSATLTYHMAP